MTNRSNLRLYSFCNFYLNSISQGIQTAHVIGRMSQKYRNIDSPQSELYWDWLKENQQNETIIVLNGGMGADIYEAYKKFKGSLENFGIPTGIFFEEPRALGIEGSSGSPTSWACVLPDYIYNTRLFPGGIASMDAYGKENEGEEGFELIALAGTELFEFLQYKGRCPLAR